MKKTIGLICLLCLCIFTMLGARTLVNLAQDVTGILAVANGGNGTASPTLTAGTNVSLSGSWPNYTINATNSGGGSGIGGSGVGYGSYLCSNVTGSGFGCTSSFNLSTSQTIIFLCSYYTGSTAGTPSMSDTLGLTWNQIATTFNSTGHVGVTAWWGYTGASSGADTFTCANTNSISFGGVSAHLVIGASSTAPIDVSTTDNTSSSFNLPLTTTTGPGPMFLAYETDGGLNLFPGVANTSNQIGALWVGLAQSANVVHTFRPVGPAGKYYIVGTVSNNHALVAFTLK